MMIGPFFSNMTCTTSGAGTAYPSDAPEFLPVFIGIFPDQSIKYFVDICVSFRLSIALIILSMYGI